MILHRQCSHYIPAMSANGRVENRDHHGTCDIPCIKWDTLGRPHATWRAIWGDEAACGAFEEAGK